MIRRTRPKKSQSNSSYVFEFKLASTQSQKTLECLFKSASNNIIKIKRNHR